jgi:hypothetical protein
MDTLLTEVPHFPVPTDTESITVSLAARAQNLKGSMSCFVPFSPQVPGLAFAATKKCLQSGNHDFLGLLGPVAAGLLTEE